jgi:hypothetical protein
LLEINYINFPGDTFDGTYWRINWDHTLALDSSNRINLGLGYRSTMFDAAAERNTNVLTGSLSYTVTIE